MKSIIRVPAKPHVAAFIRNAYGSPAVIPRKCILYDLIEMAVTYAPAKQYTTTLSGHEDLFIQMPGNLTSYAIPTDRAARIALGMEKHFWDEAVKYIIEHLRTVPKSDKRQAIEAFYSQFQIAEDNYSYDSFRRRLIREEVNNINSRPNVPVRSRFRCVSNYDARMIYLYVTKDGLSYRQVSNLYHIGKSSVEKIVKIHKKIFQTLS